MALITQGAIDTIWAELKAEIDKAIEKRMPRVTAPGSKAWTEKAWTEIAIYEDVLRIARRVLDRVYMTGGSTLTKDHRSD